MLYNFYLFFKSLVKSIISLSFKELNTCTKLVRLQLAKVFISLRRLPLLGEDLDYVRLYNYFYVFRFFFGLTAMVFKVSTLFSMRVIYSYFDISSTLKNDKDIFFLLYFFVFELKGLNISFDYYLKASTCTIIL